MLLPGFELGARDLKVSALPLRQRCFIGNTLISFIINSTSTFLEKYIKCYCQLINVFYKFKTYCIYHIYDINVTVILRGDP